MGNCHVSTLRNIATVGFIAGSLVNHMMFPQSNTMIPDEEAEDATVTGSTRDLLGSDESPRNRKLQYLPWRNGRELIHGYKKYGQAVEAHSNPLEGIHSPLPINSGRKAREPLYSAKSDDGNSMKHTTSQSLETVKTVAQHHDSSLILEIDRPDEFVSINADNAINVSWNKGAVQRLAPGDYIQTVQDLKVFITNHPKEFPGAGTKINEMSVIALTRDGEKIWEWDDLICNDDFWLLPGDQVTIISGCAF